MTTLIQLVLVPGLMVLVHELGHFAAARACRVRVEAFAIGFGRRLFGFHRNGTEYRINLLPLGGYVKMTGEKPGSIPTSDPGDLNNHPRWQRILIALAGPAANFLLAFTLMTGAFMLHNQVVGYLDGPAVTDYISPAAAITATGIRSGDTIVHFDSLENPTWLDVYNHASLNSNRTVPFSFLHNGQRTDTSFRLAFPGSSIPVSSDKFSMQTALSLGLVPRMQAAPLRVASIAPVGPATLAGLRVNDQILAVDGIDIRSPQTLFWYLQDQHGRPALLTLARDGRVITLPVTPAQGNAANPGYQLGFTPAEPAPQIEHLSFPRALAASFDFNRKNSLLVVGLFQGMFQRRISVRSLSGPIGIGQVVHSAAQAPGWLPLLGAIAMISINLGVFNLLPFPILDGGMIFLLLAEGAFQRTLPVQVKKQIYQVAFACVVLFAVVVIFNDITKLQLFTHLKS